MELERTNTEDPCTFIKNLPFCIDQNIEKFQGTQACNFTRNGKVNEKKLVLKKIKQDIITLKSPCTVLKDIDRKRKNSMKNLTFCKG